MEVQLYQSYSAPEALLKFTPLTSISVVSPVQSKLERDGVSGSVVIVTFAVAPLRSNDGLSPLAVSNSVAPWYAYQVTADAPPVISE